jgi:hypothetical protein
LVHTFAEHNLSSFKEVVRDGKARIRDGRVRISVGKVSTKMSEGERRGIGGGGGE